MADVYFSSSWRILEPYGPAVQRLAQEGCRSTQPTTPGVQNVELRGPRVGAHRGRRTAPGPWVTLTMNSPDPDVELLRGQIAEWAMAHHEEINANRTTHI